MAKVDWFNDLAVCAAYYAHGGCAVANPSNSLGYDPTTHKLAAYEANNTRTTRPRPRSTTAPIASSATTATIGWLAAPITIGCSAAGR
jgi:hypothetical protein